MHQSCVRTDLSAVRHSGRVSHIDLAQGAVPVGPLSPRTKLSYSVRRDLWLQHPTMLCKRRIYQESSRNTALPPNALKLRILTVLKSTPLAVISLINSFKTGPTSATCSASSTDHTIKT